MNGLKQIPRCWLGINDYEEILFQEVQEALRFWGNKYIDAGYGRSFVKWLKSDTPTPYGSWGNGSAMRASFAGWFAEKNFAGQPMAVIDPDTVGDKTFYAKWATPVEIGTTEEYLESELGRRFAGK